MVMKYMTIFMTFPIPKMDIFIIKCLNPFSVMVAKENGFRMVVETFIYTPRFGSTRCIFLLW